MKLRHAALGLVLALPLPAAAGDDQRQLVELPAPMQAHMLANMRGHLEDLNAIMQALSAGQLDKAGEIAERRLGMSSLDAHGAAHMAQFMPEAMRSAGTEMHHAASRFALVAQEGDRLRAYEALGAVTTQCVACHAGFRIR